MSGDELARMILSGQVDNWRVRARELAAAHLKLVEKVAADQPYQTQVAVLQDELRIAAERVEATIPVVKAAEDRAAKAETKAAEATEALRHLAVLASHLTSLVVEHEPDQLRFRNGSKHQFLKFVDEARKAERYGID